MLPSLTDWAFTPVSAFFLAPEGYYNKLINGGFTGIHQGTQRIVHGISDP
jgi:hypothetical protein